MGSRIVLCGSMSSYAEMERISDSLQAAGITCLLPAVETRRLSATEFVEFKQAVSYGYFTDIRAPETGAILVVNTPKHGLANYIGPSALAEIAMAFHACKPIYLLEDVFAPMAVELLAWAAIALRGDLGRLIDDARNGFSSSRSQAARVRVHSWRRTPSRL